MTNFRPLRPVLLLLAALSLTGCVTLDLLVRVRPDGSGTITRRIAFRTDWIEQLSKMLQEPGKEGEVSIKVESKENDFELFTEKDAREEAAKMGAGVRFVKATPTKDARSRGQVAVYEFSDVTKLALSDEPPNPMGGDAGPAKERMHFSFSKSGGVSTLGIRVPKSEPKPKGDEEAKTAPKGETKVPTEEELAKAREILGGLRIAMAVEVEGKIVDATGGWRDGNRVTLLEMDFDKLLSDPKSLQRLAASDAKSLDEARPLLRDIPGFRIPVDGETVTIRFR